MAENSGPPGFFIAFMIFILGCFAIAVIRSVIISFESCCTEEDENERGCSAASSNLRSTTNVLSRPQPNYGRNGCIVWAIQDPSGGVDIYHMNNEGHLHPSNGAYSGFIGRLDDGGGHQNSGFSRGLDTIGGYQDSRFIGRLDNVGGHEHSGFSHGLDIGSGHQNSGLSQGLDTASSYQNSGFSGELASPGGHQNSGLSRGLDTVTSI